MSNTATVINLSDFNINVILQELKLSQEDKTAVQCVRFMYRMIRDEAPSSDPSAKGRAEFTAANVVEEIKPRLDIYQAHKDDFFKHYPAINHNALMIAITCEKYMSCINGPIHEKDGRMSQECRDDGLDNKAVAHASLLLKQASELQTEGCHEEEALNDDEVAQQREIDFIAHLQALENMIVVNENFENHDFENLQKILEIDIPAAQEFLDASTELGRLLALHVDHVEARIATLRPSTLDPVPPPAPAKRGGHLRLVTLENHPQ